MSLTLDIKPNDALAKSALAAASALDRVAANESKVNALSRQSSLVFADAAKNANALAKYTDVYGKRAETAYGTTHKLADVGKKDRSKMLAQVNSVYAQEKKVVDVEKKKKDAIEKGAGAFKTMGGAVTIAAAAAVALGTAIALSAKKAFDARREAGALVDAFTGHRGPEALKKLDALAQSLGASTEDVRAKFVEFRQAGLNNDLSGRLIKMRADLMALGLSAGAADKEISAVTGAADGIYNLGAERKLNELARAYKGAGTGALAAARSMQTIEGAENRLSNVATEAMAKLWEKIAPSIGKAANAAADFAIAFIQSERGQAVIDGIAGAIVGMVDAARSGVTAVGGLFDFLSENKVAVITSLTLGITALGVAMAISFGPAIIAATGAALAVAALPLAIAAAAVGVGLAVQAIVKHWDVIEDLANAAYRWGKDIVTGLIAGITGAIGSAVQVVSGLAGKVSSTFADALGIHSPSKLFADYGKNTVQGFEQGQERELSNGSMPITKAASAAPTAQPGASSGGTSDGGGRSVTITIETLNVTADSGEAPEIATAIRRELQLLLRSGALSRGFA